MIQTNCQDNDELKREETSLFRTAHDRNQTFGFHLLKP